MDARPGHRLPFIDGLRALAVAGVVWYHLDHRSLPGGFSGVDVFLVVSGFVVSASVARTQGESQWIARFFARRVKRLFPALALCLLATATACSLWVPDAWLGEGNANTARMAFFGLSNWLIVARGDDYFSPIIDFNPYAHTWSLGLEEQFYLLFPLVFAAWSRGRRGRGIACAISISTLGLSVAYAAIGGATFQEHFHWLPSRAWEFLAGVVAWQALQFAATQARSRPHGLCWDVLALIGVAAVLGSFLHARASTFPFPGALLAVGGTTAILIALSLREGGGAHALLGCRPLAAVGRMSYSLYLWHWPVFVVFRWTLGLDTIGFRVLAACIAVTLGYLSYRLVEPVMERRFTAWRPRSIIACGVLAMIVGATLHGQIARQASHWSQSTVMRNAGDWYPTTRARGESPCGDITRTNASVGTGRVTTLARAACADDSPAPRLFVIGDSHALALGPAFATYTARTGATTFLYNNGGCPTMSLMPEREDSDHCRQSFQAAWEHMSATLGEGDVVALPSLRMARKVDQWGPVEKASEAVPAGLPEARALLVKLRSKGARVVLFAPNLVLDIPLFRCADTWTAHQSICQPGSSVRRDEFERRRAPMVRALESLAAADEGVAVFDPVGAICPVGPVCGGYANGRPLFFDGDHLSAFGSRSLAPSFTEAVRALANK
ncbi:acyltransferase [Bacillus sp. NP157]|nr:acyltransferase [Bacillus sp. NP157]